MCDICLRKYFFHKCRIILQVDEVSKLNVLATEKGHDKVRSLNVIFSCNLLQIVFETCFLFIIRISTQLLFHQTTN